VNDERERDAEVVVLVDVVVDAVGAR
jgi:hypothetical protein